MQTSKRWISWVRSFLPSKLPTGMTDLELFIDSILTTYQLPENDTFRGAVCTMILHLAPDSTWKPKRHFAKAILKSMANQVAYEQMQRYKEKAKEPKLEVVGGDQSERTTEEVVQETQAVRVQ